MNRFLAKLKRENKIESLAERNAAWSMVAILITGILYQAIKSSPDSNDRILGDCDCVLAVGKEYFLSFQF